MTPLTRRSLLAAALLLGVAGTSHAAEKGFNRVSEKEGGPRLWGKTYAQILAMGSEAWMEYQGKKAGISTPDMSEGMAAYTDALRWRNDRLAAKAGAERRRQVNSLRPLLEAYTRSLVNVGSFTTGGGTIWSTIAASSFMDAEERLYFLLGGRGGKAEKPHTTGEVNRALNALEEDVRGAELDREGRKEAQKFALEELAKARASFKKIAVIAATLPRKDSDRILAYCLEMTTASDFEGEK